MSVGIYLAEIYFVDTFLSIEHKDPCKSCYPYKLIIKVNDLLFDIEIWHNLRFQIVIIDLPSAATSCCIRKTTAVIIANLKEKVIMLFLKHSTPFN